MTDHSKIPLPEDERPRTLIERAEGLFGLGGFKPAPVPRTLAPATNRPVPRRPAAERPVPADPATPSMPESKPASAAAPATAPAAAPATAPVAAPAPAPAPLAFPAQVVPIDRAQLRAAGLIEPNGPVTALREEFRIVKRQVLLAMRDAQARSGGAARAQRVLVCSPLPGEGKTFCAANLALAMASEKDSEVVLVDADFAKPSILSTLGLPGGNGLMDALANPAIRVEDCVIRTDVPGLFVLPAGHQTASDSEHLTAAHAAEVLERLTRGAPNRIVIFDSPPALAASPAAELAKHVAQALVIVRADRTGQSALEDALSLLSACPDIKLLLNAADFSPSGRRFGAYYGHGG
ncbi:capsular biosynthesis protein [Altererythrobacter sp. B11]|uniref:AAA family ATPase n=1 Tax=Altererythrobacter sp. B11 TaxID=2060312 RepID=UPI000DC6EDAD|nr:AAA family ATPase [Altererythrobacter sp. B11]BBC72973.1 capsular biosynthesis protein [Altererythrobacter sp. B11]